MQRDPSGGCLLQVGEPPIPVNFMGVRDRERRPGAPQSRTRGHVSTSGRTLGVLECGGRDAAHGGEDAERFMESAHDSRIAHWVHEPVEAGGLRLG
jgi:hypothetical protein